MKCRAYYHSDTDVDSKGQINFDMDDVSLDANDCADIRDVAIKKLATLPSGGTWIIDKIEIKLPSNPSEEGFRYLTWKREDD